ncbi:MAG: histidine phosphatase family protein [Rhodanobacteraceae bacterium]
MSTNVTTCLLVRHGHVQGIDPPRFRGHADLPLTSRGERQAQVLGDRITREWSPVAIYASPLSRCMDTGAIIGRTVHLTPQPVEGLLDIDYGQWQGLTDDDVHAKWPEAWARWRNMPQTAEIPGGESLQNLATRTVRALHDVLHWHRGDTVVAVAHDSVNRVLLLHALDFPLQRYWSIQQAPCALNVLEHAGGKLLVRTLNETGHTLGL